MNLFDNININDLYRSRPIPQSAAEAIQAIISTYDNTLKVANNAAYLTLPDIVRNMTVNDIIKTTAKVSAQISKSLNILYNRNIYSDITDILEKNINRKSDEHDSDLVTSDNAKETDEIIINKILAPDEIYEESTSNKNAILTVTPVTAELMKYITENPSALYELSPREFELFMAEFYSKLGYKAQCTQSSRDGGKDIILSQETLAGNFVYYVECKRYKPTSHVGVGIVRSLSGVVNAERVNGGFVATTSFFSRPARDFIKNNNLKFTLQLHDFDFISTKLKQIQC